MDFLHRKETYAIVCISAGKRFWLVSVHSFGAMGEQSPSRSRSAHRGGDDDDGMGGPVHSRRRMRITDGEDQVATMRTQGVPEWAITSFRSTAEGIGQITGRVENLESRMAEQDKRTDQRFKDLEDRMHQSEEKEKIPNGGAGAHDAWAHYAGRNGASSNASTADVFEDPPEYTIQFRGFPYNSKKDAIAEFIDVLFRPEGALHCYLPHIEGEFYGAGPRRSNGNLNMAESSRAKGRMWNIIKAFNKLGLKYENNNIKAGPWQSPEDWKKVVHFTKHSKAISELVKYHGSPPEPFWNKSSIKSGNFIMGELVAGRWVWHFDKIKSCYANAGVTVEKIDAILARNEKEFEDKKCP